MATNMTGIVDDTHENIAKQEIPDDYKGPPIFCSYTRLVPTGQLKPNPENPNKHPRRQISLLQKVIAINGWRAPIVVSNLSGLIVKGEGRWTTAIQAGWSHVPVDFQDYLSPELELADLAADNELAALAEMDKKKRQSLLEGLNTGALADMEVVGIPMAVLEEMFNESRKDENKALFPMAAQLHERYDYVLIFTSNETDAQYLRELAGMRKEVSYKMTKEVGLGRSIPFERFMESLEAHGFKKGNHGAGEASNFGESQGKWANGTVDTLSDAEGAICSGDNDGRGQSDAY